MFFNNAVHRLYQIKKCGFETELIYGFSSVLSFFTKYDLNFQQSLYKLFRDILKFSKHISPFSLSNAKLFLCSSEVVSVSGI